MQFSIQQNMNGNPTISRRRTLRLKGYDYSQAGAYFVTICVHGKKCLLGDVIGSETKANELGRIVQEAWDDLPVHYPHVATDVFVVMPNHVHGVVVLRDVGAGFVRAGLKPAPTARTNSSHTAEPARTARHGLSEIVRAFKTFSARRINEFRETAGAPVWQRNYYEHVIRDDADYNRIAEYVTNNPKRWMEDSLHPEFVVGAYGNTP